MRDKYENEFDSEISDPVFRNTKKTFYLIAKA